MRFRERTPGMLRVGGKRRRFPTNDSLSYPKQRGCGFDSHKLRRVEGKCTGKGVDSIGQATEHIQGIFGATVGVQPSFCAVGEKSQGLGENESV